MYRSEGGNYLNRNNWAIAIEKRASGGSVHPYVHSSRNIVGWDMGSNNSILLPEGGAIVLMWLGCWLWTFERVGKCKNEKRKTQKCIHLFALCNSVSKDLVLWGVLAADSLIVSTILDMTIENLY